jgi:hypothetical protein
MRLHVGFMIVRAVIDSLSVKHTKKFIDGQIKVISRAAEKEKWSQNLYKS